MGSAGDRRPQLRRGGARPGARRQGRHREAADDRRPDVEGEGRQLRREGLRLSREAAHARRSEARAGGAGMELGKTIGLVEGKATRVAFGEMLRDLGAEDSSIVVVDADLNNSTRTDIFMKAHPD